MRKNAEKPFAAWIATVGVESQEAFREEQGAVFNPIARNSLEVEIPAFRAMGEPCEGDRHTMAVKAALAGVAAPGLESGERNEKVQDSAAMRAVAVRAAALRTNQRSNHLGWMGKYIQFS